MKNIKYLLVSAFAMTTAFFAASCSTDGNDWGTDSSKSHYFTPTSVSVSTSEGATTVTWKTYDKAKSYQIEIIGSNGQYSIDPYIGNNRFNGDTIVPGTVKDIVPNVTSDYVYEVTDEESVKNGSYTIGDQLTPGMYQLRIRALASDVKGESKWLYFVKDNDSFFEISDGGSDEEDE